jgi:hypothetical protein
MNKPVEREQRFDVLRNSKDLYGSIFHIIATLSAYHQSTYSGDVPSYFQMQDLCRIAAKISPHLPAPAKDANVWKPWHLGDTEASRK